MAIQQTLQFRVVLAVAAATVLFIQHDYAHALATASTEITTTPANRSKSENNNTNSARSADDALSISTMYVSRGHTARLECDPDAFWRRASLRARDLNADNNGGGGVDVRWLHNGVTLERGDIRFKVFKNGTLVIPKLGKRLTDGANTSMEGVYQCISESQRFGSALTEIVHVQFAYMKEFFRQPNDLHVEEGQPAILPCSVNSLPRASVLWERDDQPLPQHKKYVPLPSGSLLITNVHSSDIGSYRCKVINNILKKAKRSRAAQLSIANALEIEEDIHFLPVHNTTDVTVNIGDSVTLYCVVSTGNKITSLRWLNGNDLVIGNTSILLLHNVTLRHAGRYTCSVVAPEGGLQKVYNVVVQQAPVFNSTPSSGVHILARTIRLNCTASGWPPPTISWYKNGLPFNVQAHIRAKAYNWGLLISSSTASDSGVYQCKATNSAGTSWSGASVKLNASNNNPSEPRDIQCLPYQADSVCLRWRGEQNVQAYTIIAHRTDAELAEDRTKDYLTNETHILLEKLHIDTNYTFLIRTFSKKASTEFANVTCNSGVRGQRNFTAQLEGTSVMLSWQPLSSDYDPCSNRRAKPYLYKVQWRRQHTDGFNSVDVAGLETTISALPIGATYEFQVIAASSLMSVHNLTVTIPKHFYRHHFGDNTLENALFNSTFINETEEHKFLAAPLQIDAVALSTSGINVTWWDSNPSSTTYTLCYLIFDERKPCEVQGKFLRDLPTRSVTIERLRPKTTYEIKVQAQHEEQTTRFSHSLFITTPSDVPSEVQHLEYKVLTRTSACVKWEPPVHSNGRINKYSIRHTPNNSLPLEKWLASSILIPPNNDGCWNNLDQDAIVMSTILHDLDPDVKYFVNILAVNDAGSGNPTQPLLITTKFPMPNENEETGEDLVTDADAKLYHRQWLGVALGFVIAIGCILLCIIAFFLHKYIKRQWVLRRFEPNGVVYAATTCSSRSKTGNGQQCNVDAHELQQLVTTNGHSHIPIMPTPTLDTKGDSEFPNGIQPINKGNAYHNGDVTSNLRIRQNPQYYKKGVGTSEEISSLTATGGYEEDSNSNLQMVCPLKKVSSWYGRSEVKNGAKHRNVRDDHNEYNSSLDTTQTTVLMDSSLTSSTPTLEPNG